MQTVRKHIALALVLFLLAPMLSACGTSLGIPRAEALLSFLWEDFTCGFTVTENEAELAAASIVRRQGCDTLTYEKNGLRVIFQFEGGESYLCTAKSETEEALTLPVTLPEAYGISLIESVFSALPASAYGTNTASVARIGEGYLLELANGDRKIEWLFSTEFVPLSVTCGETVLTVTSFSKNS